MPADLRIPWVLHRVERLSLPETAAACEVSLATVKRRIADAEARIERRLGPTEARATARTGARDEHASTRSLGARELDSEWGVERSERVREGALRRRDVRVRRDRALRRGLVVASGAGLLVLALLRAASSAPAEREATASTPTVAVAPPVSEALAARSSRTPATRATSLRA